MFLCQSSPGVLQSLMDTLVPRVNLPVPHHQNWSQSLAETRPTMTAKEEQGVIDRAPTLSTRVILRTRCRMTMCPRNPGNTAKSQRSQSARERKKRKRKVENQFRLLKGALSSMLHRQKSFRPQRTPWSRKSSFQLISKRSPAMIVRRRGRSTFAIYPKQSNRPSIRQFSLTTKRPLDLWLFRCALRPSHDPVLTISDVHLLCQTCFVRQSPILGLRLWQQHRSSFIPPHLLTQRPKLKSKWSRSRNTCLALRP